MTLIDLFFKIASVFLPLFYIGKWNKKTVVCDVGENVKIKARVNTFDKLAIFEVWGLKEYEVSGFEINPNDVVVDIGAHIGTFSVWVAKKAHRGKVYSFEPDKDSYSLLKENKKINKLNNLNLYNLAVSGKEGRAILYKSDRVSVGNSFYNNGHAEGTSVPTISLELFFKRYKLKKIDFLKIDTEGSEYDIILNTPQKLLRKIDRIIVEYHDYLEHGHNWKELKEYLLKAGFNVDVGLSFIQRHVFKLGHIRAWRDIKD
ncbi:FkbM family methyltransferase [Patescibacteria group bacterium]|nr:FkbM family methyltransferase [Patescibacteria group bacterium]